MQNSKEEKVKSVIPQLSGDIIENIDSFVNILTELEWHILHVLLKNQFPMTTKAIRREVVLLISKEDTSPKNVENCYNLYCKRERIKIHSHGRSRLFSKPGFIDYLEKQLNKLGLKFPSFDKIDYTLKALERATIVGRRFDSGQKKIKYLWVLNPLFFIKWKERQEEVMKNPKKYPEKIRLFYSTDW